MHCWLNASGCIHARSLCRELHKILPSVGGARTYTGWSFQRCEMESIKLKFLHHIAVMHLDLVPNPSHSSFFVFVTVQLCCDNTSWAAICVCSTFISTLKMLNFLLLGFIKCPLFVNWLRTSVFCKLNVSVQSREKPFESRFGAQTTPSSRFCSSKLEITFQTRRGHYGNRDVLAAIKNKSVLV